MTALTWGAYKTTIRRSILKDEAESQWTNEQLQDFAGWALDAFCAHTAVASSVIVPGDGTTVEFSLPADLFESLEISGQVLLNCGTTTYPKYLKPAYSSFEIAPTDNLAFRLWPTDKLTLNVAPTTSESLEIRYYAYYAHPVDDSDVLTLPSWAYTAVAYDIATHAMTWRSLMESIDSAYKQKPENGQPENNSARQTQAWWVKLYDRELARHPRQKRITIPK